MFWDPFHKVCSLTLKRLQPFWMKIVSSRIKVYEFWQIFDWSWFLVLTFIQSLPWFRPWVGTVMVPGHFLNQCWISACLVSWGWILFLVIIFSHLISFVINLILFFFFQGDQPDSANFLVDQLLYCDFVPNSIKCIKKSELNLFDLIWYKRINPQTSYTRLLVNYLKADIKLLYTLRGKFLSLNYKTYFE